MSEPETADASPRTIESASASAREKLIEHVFLGELLRCLWQKGKSDIEVLRPEVDAGGYDLAIECDGILRHIQLKSTRAGGKAAHVDIHTKLAAKPSGCVIWISFDERSLNLGPFLWMGGAPGEPLSSLGDKLARHSRADSTGSKRERPQLRAVAKRQFIQLSDIGEVAEALFGRSEASS